MVQSVGNLCSIPLDINDSGPLRKLCQIMQNHDLPSELCPAPPVGDWSEKIRLRENSIFIPIEEDVSNSKGKEKYSGKEI